MIMFPGFRDNINPIIITDEHGKILHYNAMGKVFLRTYEGPVEGVNLVNFIDPDDRDTFTKILLMRHSRQPYVLHGLNLKGILDPVVLRLYQYDSNFMVIFESFQITEEVFVATQERKWAERLQIMLFGISHELKTPLAVARGYTEVLENADTHPATKNVRDALDRISLILNDMTEPVRQINERNDSLDLGHSIEMYCRTMPYIEPTKRYIGAFEADIEYGDGKNINMAKPRFYQILNNLFENAIRATDHLDTDAHIHIGTHRCTKPHHNSCVVMTFTDNGCGMTDEQCQKVFTPYYTTRGPKTGTGLGGYFVYQFVMDAGGSISAESKEGEGTTFTMHLPLK